MSITDALLLAALYRLLFNARACPSCNAEHDRTGTCGRCGGNGVIFG